MNYTVVWKPEAEENLTSLWNDARDRAAVTAAANEIDSFLGTNPDSAGESRRDDQRILTVSPLSVFFDVSEDDRRVDVWPVWRSDRKR